MRRTKKRRFVAPAGAGGRGLGAGGGGQNLRGLPRNARLAVHQALPGVRRLTRAQQSRVEKHLSRLPYYRHVLRIVAGDNLPMHAASFLPHRHIVLDRELLGSQKDLARVLYHEVFHFVWARLGNPLRQSWERLLRREWEDGARGELGWPAEERKLRLRPAGARRRSRQWLEYACESFCDSAAWFCLPSWRAHEEWTLKPRFRARRRRWFLAADVLPRLAGAGRR